MSTSKGFGSVLRSSRLASVSKPSRPKYGDGFAPKYQVIQSTPSSLYRKDFGLKRVMPASSTTPYITVQALDSPYGMTSYEFGSSFHFKSRRFQEIGAPLSSQSIGSSLFEKSSTTKQWLDVKPIDASEIVRGASSRRQEFIKWVQERTQSPPSPISKDSSKIIDDFYNIAEPSALKTIQPSVVKGNAGLSYLLKGSIKNTPKGAILYREVKGRPINTQRSEFSNGGNKFAAIGGFVVQWNKINSNTSFYIDGAQHSQNGTISMRAKGVTEMKNRPPSTSFDMASNRIKTTSKLDSLDNV